MRIITGRGEYVTESRCSRVSFRRRGSTVQGTNKRNQNTERGSRDRRRRHRRRRRCGFSVRSRELDRPIERDARRALNMQRIRNTRHTPERKTGSERERDVRHFIFHTSHAQHPLAREIHGTEKRRTLTSLLVGDLIEAVLKDLVQMHRLVVGRHVFARDVKPSGRSVVEASGHGFAVRPRAEPPSSRYDHPHY